MLGGRVIGHQLDYAFAAQVPGRSFFIADKGTRANWSRLMVVLEEICTQSSMLDVAVAGALQAFDFFEHCVTSNYHPNAAQIAMGRLEISS